MGKILAACLFLAAQTYSVPPAVLCTTLLNTSATFVAKTREFAWKPYDGDYLRPRNGDAKDVANKEIVIAAAQRARLRGLVAPIVVALFLRLLECAEDL